MKTLFVTGTSTDVGKTWVSCLLLLKMNELGLSTVAMKPVAAGCDRIEGGLRNKDALLLQRCMSADMSYQQVNPIAFEAPIAPHIAAQNACAYIQLDSLVAHAVELQQRREDVLLIEGAGGWRVPLNDRESLCDLPAALNVGVVLVVDMTLGCLNHSLLTVRDIESMGLSVLGWVANQTQAETMQCYEQNVDALKRMIKAPCLGCVSYSESGSLISSLSDIDSECLMSLCDALTGA
ncbi:MAG: dethiobiotin synthase, partial [Pseudomonadota bacterium]